VINNLVSDVSSRLTLIHGFNDWVLSHMLTLRRGLIGMEENKPEAANFFLERFNRPVFILE
tara:strand:+ start:220 stop:402 length:183 start_codon:yes stop_codon:yes gene_type:complete